MGKIYCVMGKSSSGKDTVYKKLKEQYKEFRLIVPYTTRPIREGEKDGVEYYFVDPEQFRAMKEDGKVIESRSYNTKCGIWTYFTADDGQIDLSAADYLLIGTLVSYQALREYFGEEATRGIISKWKTDCGLPARLSGNADRRSRNMRRCAAVFLRTRRTFRKKILSKAGLQSGLAMKISQSV